MRDYLKANLFILSFILIYFILESKNLYLKLFFFHPLFFPRPCYLKPI